MNTESLFDELMKYHFETRHQTSVKSRILQYGFIFLNSTFSLSLYINPSLQYAGAQLIYRVLYVMGAIISNFAAFFWAGSLILDYLIDLNKPEYIQSAVSENQTRSKKIITSVSIFAVGVLPSLMPASAAFQTSTKTTSLRIAEFICVFLGELPFNIFGVLNLYQALLVVVKKWCFKFKENLESDPDLKLEYAVSALREKQSDEQKSMLSRRLSNGFSSIIVEQKFQVWGNLQGIALLRKILDNKENDEENSCAKTVFTARKLFGFSGALLGLTEMTGFAMSTHYFIGSFIDVMVGRCFLTVLIVSIPSYLSAKFGYASFVSIFDVVRDRLYGKYDKPLALVLYHKVAIIMTIFMLFCASFSYATSVKLVVDNFSYPYLLPFKILSMISGIMFNAYCSINFVGYVLRLFALNFGHEREKFIAHLAVSLESLLYDLKRVDPVHFQNEVNLLSQKDYNAFFSDHLSDDLVSNQKKATAVGIDLTIKTPLLKVSQRQHFFKAQEPTASSQAVLESICS